MVNRRLVFEIEFCLFFIITNIWLGKITEKINLQSIFLLVNICICLVMMHILYRSGILVLNRKQLKNKIVKNKLLIIYAILCISIIGMNIYNHSIGNITEGLFLLLMMLLFLYPIKNIDFFNVVLRATEASMILFVVLSIIFAPAMNFQYRGILINANSTAVFMVFVFLITLYGFIVKNSRRLLHLICCGLSIGYIFFIESRAAEIAVIVTIVLWIGHFVINKKNLKASLISISTIIIISLIMPTCVSLIQNDVSYCIYKNVLNEQFSIYELHYDEDRINIGNSVNSNNKDKEKSKNIIESVEENRLFSSGTDFTTGRTELWKAHIDEIGILGHNKGIELNNQVRTAHNTYIHIAYIDGIASGILLLIFNISIGVLALKQYINNKSNRNAMTLFSIIIYGMYSMVETMYFPLTTHIVFLFYLAIMNVYQNKSNIENSGTEDMLT